MGCDFYTYYVLHVKCKNDTVIKHVLDNTLKRHYFYYDEPADSDFEEDVVYNNSQDAQIEDTLSSYPKKDLYIGNTWLCIESSTNKYRGILEQLCIKEEDVCCIWKEGGAHIR